MSDQPRRRGAKPLSPAVLQGPQFVKHTPADIAATKAAMYAAGELPTPEEVVGWTQSSLLLGRIQMALVSETVSSRAIAECYRQITKSTTYVGMPYKAPDGSTKRVSSLNDLCTAFFGRSARRCQQLAANLDTLGADLFEAAEKIGLGQRDYNALKALPADDQAVVKQALAEGGDKDAVTGLLVGLTERLTAKLEKKSAEYEALSTRAARTATELDEAKARAALLPQQKPDVKAQAMERELAVLALGARGELKRFADGVTAFIGYLSQEDVPFDADALAERVVQVANGILAVIGDLRVAGIDAPRVHALSVLSL